MALMAAAIGIKTEAAPYRIGILVMIAAYVIAGIHAGYFMGNDINHQCEDDYLENFKRDALSPNRRLYHHWMFWFGLGAGGLGILWTMLFC